MFNAIAAITLYFTLDSFNGYRAFLYREGYQSTYYVGQVSVTILCAIFAILSSVFHIISLVFYNKTLDMWRSKHNLWRWLEYSMSASLMGGIISIINGVQFLYQLMYIMCAFFLLMWYGWFTELFGLGSDYALYTQIIGNVGYLLLTIPGWLWLFLQPNLSTVPAIAWASIFTIGTFFSLFGFWQCYWVARARGIFSPSSSDVSIRLYDLSHGLVKGLSRLSIVEKSELIPHVSVVFKGYEVSYMKGLCCFPASNPALYMDSAPLRTIYVGRTQWNEDNLRMWLSDNSSVFTASRYNISTNNCFDMVRSLISAMGLEYVESSVLGNNSRNVPEQLSSIWDSGPLELYDPPVFKGSLPNLGSSSGNLSVSEYVDYEKGYLILSLSSKMALFGFIIWGALSSSSWLPSGNPCGDVALNSSQPTYVSTTATPSPLPFSFTSTMSSTNSNSPSISTSGSFSPSFSVSPSFSASPSYSSTVTGSPFQSSVSSPSNSGSNSFSATSNASPAPSSSGLGTPSLSPSPSPSFSSYISQSLSISPSTSPGSSSAPTASPTQSGEPSPVPAVWQYNYYNTWEFSVVPGGEIFYSDFQVNVDACHADAITIHDDRVANSSYVFTAPILGSYTFSTSMCTIFSSSASAVPANAGDAVIFPFSSDSTYTEQIETAVTGYDSYTAMSNVNVGIGACGSTLNAFAASVPLDKRAFSFYATYNTAGGTCVIYTCTGCTLTAIPGGTISTLIPSYNP